MSERQVLNRRRVLGTATAALALQTPSLRTLPATEVTHTQTGGQAESTAASWSVEDQRPFSGQTRRLKISRHGRFLTALLFPTDYPTHFRLKPELLPLCTPAGVPVTGSHEYCFIHHQSIMCGHGGVVVQGEDSLADFYRQLNFSEPSRLDPFRNGGPKNLFTEGPSGLQRVTKVTWNPIDDGVRIDLTLRWETRKFDQAQGDVVVHERRRYEIFHWDEAIVVDLDSRLTPAERPVTLRADRHSLMGVRVHDLIDVEDGGQMIDSWGRKNPSGDYWDSQGDRAAPRWVDCTGSIGPSRVGVCMLSHPMNFRNQFYVREFGLMILSPTLGNDLPISLQQPLQFSTRFVAHDGDLAPDRAEQWYTHFANSKRFKDL